MNPKPNLLGPLFSHLQNNTKDHNNKSNDDDSINSEVAKFSSLFNCKTLYAWSIVTLDFIVLLSNKETKRQPSASKREQIRAADMAIWSWVD